MMSGLRTPANSGEDKEALGRHGVLLATLILLFVTLPAAQLAWGSTPRFQILLTLVLIAAVVVNSHQRRIFAIAGQIIATTSGSAPIILVADTLSLGLLGFTTLVMLNSLIRADRVSRDTIVGGICVYLLIGLCFTMLFLIFAELAPGAFVSKGELIARSASDPSAHATKLLYFSFVTLTTLGYGDVVPKGDLAQLFAVAEALIGQLSVTIFVARLVALYVGPGRGTNLK